MCRRKGPLDTIPYVRLVRGVVIVRTGDARRVIDFREGFRDEVHPRRFGLVMEDRKDRAPRMRQVHSCPHGMEELLLKPVEGSSRADEKRKVTGFGSGRSGVFP